MGRLFRALLSVLLTAGVTAGAVGCAPTVPHLALDKQTRPGIRTVALLQVPEPEQHVMMNMGGGAMAFGLIGGLVQAGANQSNTTELTKRMKSLNLTLGAALADALRGELPRDGYEVTYLSSVRPKTKSDGKEMDYRVIETEADAILDVWFVAAGYLSTPSSTTYEPWVRVSARLVSSQTREPMYFQIYNYGAVMKAQGIVDLPATPVFTYGTAGTLLERSGEAADGLRASIQPIAARIVEDLR